MVGRRYYLELGGALALYGLLLVASNAIDRAFHPLDGVRIAVALLPMLGALAALWAIMRQIGRMDEMQRKIQFEAIVFAFAATALITFGWGFAESAGLPRLHAFSVWPLMGVLWTVGLAISHLRYR